MGYFNKIIALSAVTTFTLLPKAIAAPVVFFDTLTDGRTSFDSQISTAGGTITTNELSSLTPGVNSWDVGGGLIITSTDAAARWVDTYNLSSAYTGLTPGGEAIEMTADGSTTSGLTFTFATPVNGFGIELEDWGTCCYPSDLYLTFDGGAPILVGSATQAADVPGYSVTGKYLTFVGAIDDSNTFSTVTFYGDAYGDVLWGGGVLRYGIVPIGSVSNPSYYPDTVDGTKLRPLADYLDEYDNSGTLQDLATTLNTYTGSQVASSLKEIFPVDSLAVSQSVVSTLKVNSSHLIDRIGTVLGSISTNQHFNTLTTEQYLPQFNFGSWTGFDDAMNQFAAVPYKHFKVDNQGVWIDGIGSSSNGKETTTSHGYKTDSYGLIGGYEIAIDDKHLIGFFLSSYLTELNMDLNIGSTDIKNYNGGIYGQKLIDSYKLAGTVTYGISKYDAERNINIGAVTAKPLGDYDGWYASVNGSISRLYEHNGIKIEPFVQTGYIVNSTDEYQETNGGVFNMNVSADKFSQVNVKGGVTFQNDFTHQDRQGSIKLKPYIGQQWEVEGSGTTIRFAEATSATSIEGRDSTLTEAGLGTELSLNISDTFGFIIGADVSFDKLESRYLGFAEVNMKF